MKNTPQNILEMVFSIPLAFIWSILWDISFFVLCYFFINCVNVIAMKERFSYVVFLSTNEENVVHSACYDYVLLDPDIKYVSYYCSILETLLLMTSMVGG